MGFASILRFLLPREERFRELLEQATANLVKAADLFLAIARARDIAERKVKLVELKAVEHQGDKITRQVFEALNSTFITPFDREDIRSIAVDLDDILDYLEGIAQFIVLFEIDDAPEPLTRFAEILRDLCRQIDELTHLIWDLANEERIQEGMVRISDLENQADALYLTSLGALFRKDNGTGRARGHEVERDLPGSRGRLRQLQGLHPRPRQRGDQERLTVRRDAMTWLVGIILVALVFDFLNGFHDAANSIATVVSTRVLSPHQAVAWAAFFNFVAAFVLGTHVAKTIGKGMIDLSVVTQEVILAGLIGAILWNLFTWYYGIPVSSSHALIGGYAGAAIAKAGSGRSWSRAGPRPSPSSSSRRSSG